MCTHYVHTQRGRRGGLREVEERPRDATHVHEVVHVQRRAQQHRVLAHLRLHMYGRIAAETLRSLGGLRWCQCCVVAMGSMVCGFGFGVCTGTQLALALFFAPPDAFFDPPAAFFFAGIAHKSKAVR